MKENILLLCLSMLNPAGKINEYSCHEENEDQDTITGYLTNEAPAKYIIQKLARNNKKLDKVVMICSDTVMNPIGLSFAGESAFLSVPGMVNGKDIREVTHAEYYSDAISRFAESQSDDYKMHGIRFETVRIPDFTIQEDVSKAVIEASTRILESGNDVDLFIDFNGGQRYIAFMILAISGLMKIRHVNIAQVLTMNWGERDQRGRIPIHDMKDLFLTIDLAAGIKEYTNYGRTKGLKDYFGNTGNQRIRKLISDMTSLAENLQLCRTDYVMAERGKLLKSLNEFVQDENKEQNDTETILFYYVVNDILQEYQGLLDGELPNIVKWCIDHDFIQQAITFCTDQMPQFFYEKGILYPSRQEKAEFQNFLQCAAEKKNTIPLFIRNTFRNPQIQETSPLFAYYWMINYLMYSYGDNRGQKNEYETVVKDCPENIKQLMFIGPSKNEMQSYQRINIPFLKSGNKKKNQISLARKTEWYTKRTEQVRAESKVANYMDYINMYYLLKEQRNKINHSDGEAKDRWSYDLLCEALAGFADALLNLKYSG